MIEKDLLLLLKKLTNWLKNRLQATKHHHNMLLLPQQFMEMYILQNLIQILVFWAWWTLLMENITDLVSHFLLLKIIFIYIFQHTILLNKTKNAILKDFIYTARWIRYLIIYYVFSLLHQ